MAGCGVGSPSADASAETGVSGRGPARSYRGLGAHEPPPRFCDCSPREHNAQSRRSAQPTDPRRASCYSSRPRLTQTWKGPRTLHQPIPTAGPAISAWFAHSQVSPMIVVCSALLVKDQVTARIVPRGRRTSRGVVSCCHGDSRGRQVRCAQHRGGPMRSDGRRPWRSGRETRVGQARPRRASPEGCTARWCRDRRMDRRPRPERIESSGVEITLVRARAAHRAARQRLSDAPRHLAVRR
jgi:hypothetical protein